MIKANLKKTITFLKDGKEIVVPVDSIISVDTELCYAVWHEIHFDIFPDEYTLTA